MSVVWSIKPFEEAVSSRGSGASALAKKEWQKTGKFPVIGQGAEEIEGWSDREDLALYPAQPLVLYGGHTRRAKFIEEPFIPGPNVRILRPRSGLDAKFLYYFLTGFEVESKGYADHFPEVRKTRVPLPPLEEQKRIVAELDQAFAALDRAQAHAEANLADAEQIFERSSGMLFEQISCDGMPVATVAEVADGRRGSIRTGPFGSQLKHGEFVDEGICVLGIDNAVRNQFRWGKPRHITPEKYASLARYRVHPGDVIITIMGTCGRCAIIPDDIPLAINTKHLCCITLDKSKCLSEYLHRYFLLSPKALAYLAAQTKGTVMDGLNMGIIRELPVDLPSLEEQRTICDEIEDIEQKTQFLANVYSETVADIADLRQSLLQRAFSGQLT